MATSLLLLVTALFTASAAEGPERVRKRIAGPPLRLDTRISFRPDTAPAPLLEGAIQLWRREPIALEASVSITGGHSLIEAGPFRAFQSVDFGADLLFEAGDWFRVGPSAGVAYRTFRQQGVTVRTGAVPTLGARGQVALLRARTWSLVVSTKLQVDAGLTKVVLGSAEVRTLSPFEGQVGLRFNFGHGKTRPEPAA